MGAGAVVLTPEHRSTKTHAGCGHVLVVLRTRDVSRRVQEALDKKAERARIEAEEARQAGRDPPDEAWLRRSKRNSKKIRGQLVCTFPGCQDRHAAFVDRDVNACRNIMLAFRALDEGRPLPEHLQRKSHKEKDKEDQARPMTLRPDEHYFEERGDGGRAKPRRRAEMLEEQRREFGTSARLAGPHGARYLLLPEAEIEDAETGADWEAVEGGGWEAVGLSQRAVLDPVGAHGAARVAAAAAVAKAASVWAGAAQAPP
jgi:hypothetical protein